MYAIHKFILTNSQLKKIKNALEEDRNISLQILNKNFDGNYPLPVTEAEIKHVADGEDYVSISLSKKKLQYIRNHKEGGFLPLLSLIPMILGGIGAAGGLAGGIAAGVQAGNSKKAADAQLENDKLKLEEQSRHNREIENKLKSGSGIKTSHACYGNEASLGVGECSHCGGLLQLKVKVGKGVYLKPYHRGEGIIRAIGDAAGNPASGGRSLPDIPDYIKNIPILGTLASLIY